MVKLSWSLGPIKIMIYGTSLNLVIKVGLDVVTEITHR